MTLIIITLNICDSSMNSPLQDVLTCVIGLHMALALFDSDIQLTLALISILWIYSRDIAGHMILTLCDLGLSINSLNNNN